MRLKIALALIGLFIGHKSFGQDAYFNFKSISVEQAREIEAKWNSEPISYPYKIINKDFRQPKMFRRAETKLFPQAEVSYFYAKDSVVRETIFDWKLGVSKRDDYNKRITIYNSAFDHVIASITQILGKPAAGQGQITVEDKPVVEGSIDPLYRRRVEWRYKKYKVTTQIYWSKDHGEGFETIVKRE